MGEREAGMRSGMTSGMKLGVTIFATDRAMHPAEVAREAEARGFHSLYVPEHTHIPLSRRTPPPTGDALLAEEYKRTLDPWVALGAAAAVTSRIRLGTGIALVAQHDAITLAKQIATLDHLSNGRVALGIGYGWNEDEMESHGIDPRRRRARVREVMLAMQALWSNEVASFHGEWVDWMRNVHIPEVMATGFFTKSTMLRLLEPPADEEGITYAIQYNCNNIEALRRYQEEESPALQAKVAERYEGKYFAFRTILKVVE